MFVSTCVCNCKTEQRTVGPLNLFSSKLIDGRGPWGLRMSYTTIFKPSFLSVQVERSSKERRSSLFLRGKKAITFVSSVLLCGVSTEFLSCLLCASFKVFLLPRPQSASKPPKSRRKAAIRPPKKKQNKTKEKKTH